MIVGSCDGVLPVGKRCLSAEDCCFLQWHDASYRVLNFFVMGFSYCGIENRRSERSALRKLLVYGEVVRRSILLFPPVNNYRRFLIHKICEDFSAQYDLVTFSVGQGVTRRTVVCYKKQLLLPLEELSGDKKRKEKTKSWRSGTSSEHSAKGALQKMGVEKNITDATVKSTKTVDIYRPPALRNTQPSIPSADSRVSDLETSETLLSKTQSHNGDDNVTGTNVQSNSNQTEKPPRRERRPDRAVYVPRARRSQTTSPYMNSSTKPKSNEIMHSTVRNSSALSKESSKVRAVDVNNGDSNNKRSSLKESIPVISNCDSKTTTTIDKDQTKENESQKSNCKFTSPSDDVSDRNCDNSIRHDINTTDSTKTKSVKCTKTSKEKNNTINDNSQSTCSTSSHKMPLIESATLPVKDESKEDKEISELERMSKEINRSSRRIVKQTFNSDILEIPDNLLPKHNDQNGSTNKFKHVDPESDDWDSMFDDNGECVDPKILSELTASVGKVKIEQPRTDYKAYLLKQSILNEEEYPHVLEVSNFPVEFKTPDLMMVFSPYKESGFDIKWVDDTHALAVFSSSRIAAEVLAMGHPFVVLKPLADATVESRAKARKCAASLQPYRPRPETCAALARRLVTGALGVRLKTATEERENEKKVLREAKERKLLAAKQRDEAWES